jgi:hypothetical protein
MKRLFSMLEFVSRFSVKDLLGVSGKQAGGTDKSSREKMRPNQIARPEAIHAFSASSPSVIDAVNPSGLAEVNRFSETNQRGL